MIHASSPLSADQEQLVSEVIGAAIAVHRELGPGCLEGIYRKALCTELVSRGVGFDTEVAVDVRYHGVLLGTHRIDLVVEKLIVVELKAVDRLEPVHQSRLCRTSSRPDFQSAF
jgi:GxxExxY protein